MELTIFRRDAPTGTLRIEDAGLYRILSARIAPGPEILRLYLDGKAFGVFCPEDGAMTLHRRVSTAALPSMPNRAAAWCPSDAGGGRTHPLPARGPCAGDPLAHGRTHEIFRRAGTYERVPARR